MRNRDRVLYLELERSLIKFDTEFHSLPGINSYPKRDAFIRQLIDSIRRVKYLFTLSERPVSEGAADPRSKSFDPLKASIYFKRQGMIDEAFWLAFLSIHFGKALKSGWRLVQDVYGNLGAETNWTWEKASSNSDQFKDWLAVSYGTFTNDGIIRHFGNHRKYESLRPDSSRPTARVTESYIDWIGPARSHELHIENIRKESNSRNPEELFDALFRSMSGVFSFGRTARFDYLTMLAKLGLVDVVPGKTYMQQSTGPAKGARLLFFGNSSASIKSVKLESLLAGMENILPLGQLGMQVLEDALCNWQKNTSEYNLFKG